MIYFKANSEDPDEMPHYGNNTMPNLWDARLKRVKESISMDSASSAENRTTGKRLLRMDLWNPKDLARLWDRIKKTMYVLI